MPPRFEALLSPGESDIHELAERYPSVPFFTSAYLAACKGVGEWPCSFLVRDGAGLSAGTSGSLRKGRLTASLQISTAPELADPQWFWREIQGFCGKHRIWNLSVQTFASQHAVIPTLAGEFSRRERVEHVLDLKSGKPLAFASNHRRNINKARRAAITMTTSRRSEDVRAHMGLMQASIRRRVERGETIALPEDTRFQSALIEAGAGELVQARDGKELLTSMLILRSAQSAYYYSAGSSPRGMELGSSAFLVAALAERLTEEGLHTFNLGGAVAEDEGLWRFKTGFGGEQRQLQCVEVSTQPALIGVLKRLAGLPGRIGAQLRRRPVTAV